MRFEMSANNEPDNSQGRWARWAPTAILLAFVIVALTYSIVNPLHEATDELRHYRFARVIGTSGRLPVQGQEPCRSQSHHPPLFYALAALPTFWIDTGKEICYTPPTNPFWAYRYWEVGQDNKSQYLHGPEEAFPWRGEALAVHLMRAVNVLIGAGVVWLTWATARVIWPRRKAMALGATAFVAFNPMFLYMSGGINNDVIAALSGAAVIYACVRLLAGPQRLNWRWGVIFGGLYGLALMSKFNLAPVIALMAGSAGWAAWQRAGDKSGFADQAPGPDNGRWRRALRLWLPPMVVTVAVTSAISGWWFVRNQLLYGEPTGFQEVTELWGVRNPLESFGLAVSELPYAWTTLWGRFGFGQIPLPQAIYDGLLLVVGAGLIGAMAGFFRIGSRFQVIRGSDMQEGSPHLRPILVLLAANLLLFFAVLFNYMLVSPAGPNGRFVFPALSSLAILTFYGLGWWALTLGGIISRWRRRLAGPKQGHGGVVKTLSLVSVAGMLALSLVVLTGYLAPAYGRPAELVEGADIPNPVNARFDSLVTLLGYDVSSDSVQPGEALNLSLYWQVEAQPPGNYLLFVHLMDSAGTMVAQRDTHPGLGNFPTSLWRPGDRFVEEIRMHIPQTAYGPETATLRVGLYAPDGFRLAVSDASSGEALGDSLALTEIAIAPNKGDHANPQEQDFANDLLLVGYEYDRRVLQGGDPLAVTLYWRALRDVETDYVVKLQLLDGGGREVIAAEQRPRSGESPTRSWREGLLVKDTHQLNLPGDLMPGRYVVDLLVIDAASGAPAHILAEDGHQVNSHLELAEIRIAE